MMTMWLATASRLGTCMGRFKDWEKFSGWGIWSFCRMARLPS